MNDTQYVKNSTTYIKPRTVTQSSGHTFGDIHKTATWANNSETGTLPKLWNADIQIFYIYSQEQLFYLKTFLKQAYTAGFGSRDKILWDPALLCFSHPNIHIVITEELLHPELLLLLDDQNASYTAPHMKLLQIPISPDQQQLLWGGGKAKKHIHGSLKMQ